MNSRNHFKVLKCCCRLRNLAAHPNAELPDWCESGLQSDYSITTLKNVENLPASTIGGRLDSECDNASWNCLQSPRCSRLIRNINNCEVTEKKGRKVYIKMASFGVCSDVMSLKQ